VRRKSDDDEKAKVDGGASSHGGARLPGPARPGKRRERETFRKTEHNFLY
jgi:hypothetical protein